MHFAYGRTLLHKCKSPLSGVILNPCSPLSAQLWWWWWWNKLHTNLSCVVVCAYPPCERVTSIKRESVDRSPPHSRRRHQGRSRQFNCTGGWFMVIQYCPIPSLCVILEPYRGVTIAIIINVHRRGCQRLWRFWTRMSTFLACTVCSVFIVFDP